LVRLAVDVHGRRPRAVRHPAGLSRSFLDKHPDAELVLVGRPDALQAAQGWSRTRMVAASEVVAMDDSVEVALRRKKGLVDARGHLSSSRTRLQARPPRTPACRPATPAR
jgi:glycerol-3-phosphate acyltransferase PlsX